MVKPLNGDPFIGMLETPVTSAPVVRGTFHPLFLIGWSDAYLFFFAMELFVNEHET